LYVPVTNIGFAHFGPETNGRRRQRLSRYTLAI
jgi:hypothetical protein